MIRVAEPQVTHDDCDAILAALKKGEISGTFGSAINDFEQGFAGYSDCQFGIACTSGTTALHLALASLGIGEGDEVIVPAFTNMASFFAVHYTGAKPVPADIEIETFNIDASYIEALITPRTKAIMVVHIFGHPVDMDSVSEIANKYGLYIIEDAAEAHGGLYKGKKTGSLGHIAAFSFYANKIITTGEGGMVTTNDATLAEKCRRLQSLAYGKGENRFIHAEVGFNYRMTNYQAALGLSQMQRIEDIIARKREITQFYNSALTGIDHIMLPLERPNCRNVYWVYQILLTGKKIGYREKITSKLYENGIETRPAFTPYTQQTNIITAATRKQYPCPVAEYAGANCFYIPSSITLSDSEIEYVAKTLQLNLC